MDQQECPRQEDLSSFGSGCLTESRHHAIESHVLECPLCQSTLDALDEDSSVLVRGLAMYPCMPDDEPAFRRLHAELMAHPEPLGQATGQRESTAAGDTDSTAEVEPLPRRVAGYELLEQIGRGATGTVYRARHLKLDRTVAVKVLSPRQVGDSSSVIRFFHEMKAVGRLDHPHIIRATDAGEDEGRHFLVMEYVPGVDVSTLLQTVGPLDVADACEIARQAALGLHCAHQHKMVHRDVKPSNLLLTQSGQVKLLDLGLVSFQGGAGQATGDPDERVARGTADYMSPEQWTDYLDVDIRADLYSLGCTLYKLLAGRAPFRSLPSPYTSAMEAHARGAIPSLRGDRPDVPSGLDRVVKRLLAKSREQRYDDPQQVVDQLRSYARGADLPSLAHRAVGAGPADTPLDLADDHSPTSRGTPWLRITRRKLVTGLAAGIPLAVGSWSWLLRRTPVLRKNEWRSVLPSAPHIATSTDSRAICYPHRDDGGVIIESDGPALVMLGRPVTGQFSVRVVIRGQSEDGEAGIFFRHRDVNVDDQVVQRFHAMQLLHAKNETDQYAYRLLWSSCQMRQRDGRTRFHRDPWADVAVPWQMSDEGAVLQVTFGQSGFPMVTWNAAELPQSQWTLDRPAHHQARSPRDHWPLTYRGRVGIIQARGTTHFDLAELKYELT